jgi:hypothetical protein
MPRTSLFLFAPAILFLVLGVAIVEATSTSHVATQPAPTMLNAYTTRVTSLWGVEGAAPGTKAELWAQVQNNGSAALPSNTQVWFWVNGPNWTGSHWVGSTSVSGLAANAHQWYACEWAIPSNAPIGSYSYWARVFVEAIDISDWSAQQDFTVSASGSVPAKATLVSPTGNISTTSPAYRWNAVANSTWYYLWVNNAATVGKIQTWYKADQVGCASGIGTCSVTPATTLASGAGQWWIQTWNSFGYGPWSEAMSFMVGSGGTLGKPMLISPSGTIATSIPEFTWKPVVGAAKYLLYVNEGANEGKINELYSADQVGCASGTTNCAAKPNVTLESGPSTWRVQAQESGGSGLWSDMMRFGIGCELCQHARVAGYDLQMLAQRPATPLPNWLSLFMIGMSVRGLLFNQDQCTTHIDGKVLNANTISGGKLRIGGEYADVPPAGPIEQVDYLIDGIIQGGSAGYQVTVVIETAISREAVKSTSFSLAYNFTPDQLTAGINKAVADLGPLGKTIYDFEISKRDGDTRYALGENGRPGAAKNMHVSPKDTSLKIGQSTTVEITLLDCDGEPLADREVSLVDETDDKLGLLPGTIGGTVTPSQVHTDGSGKATVTFQAGSIPGVAVIRAHSIYLRPPGNKLAFLGEGYVSIEPPKAIWLLEADFRIKHTIDRDQKLSADKYGSYEWHFRQTIDQGWLSMSRILYYGDPGYPWDPKDYPDHKYWTGISLSNPENARYIKGHSFYSQYRIFDFYNAFTDKPHQHIDIDSSNFNADYVPRLGSMDSLDFLPRVSVHLYADAKGTETFYSSTFETGRGWTDYPPTISDNSLHDLSISCKPGDEGAQFTWNEDLGIFTATCRQIIDKDKTEEGIKDRSEKRIFVTLRKIGQVP